MEGMFKQMGIDPSMMTQMMGSPAQRIIVLCRGFCFRCLHHLYRGTCYVSAVFDSAFADYSSDNVLWIRRGFHAVTILLVCLR